MIYKYFFVVILLLSFNQPIHSQSVLNSNKIKKSNRYKHTSKVQNIRIYPSNVTQTETFIVRHPTNPDILFASANTIDLSNGFISEGIYVTTDFGNSWFGSDTCKGFPIGFHSGDPGITIDKTGRFIIIRLGFSPGLYSHYSTDLGITWSNQKTVATNDQDRATLISDNNPLSSYYGRSYAVWIKLEPPFPAVFSYSDDGADNWSSVKQINDPGQRCQGGEISMGPNGTVNLCWAGVINTSPFTEDFIGFASSSDGGVNWIALEIAFDANGIAGVFSNKSNIRVNGLPRIDTDKSGGVRNGWIYIVTTQINLLPAGSDPDIILNRSTDGGLTWSPGIRVNQDRFNNGKYQYFPAIHVDDNGGLNIVYYDDRNTTTDSAGVFLSRSTDGGDTWNDFEVSDHNFKPEPIGGLGQGYQGDNIGLTSSKNTLWPMWMDNSTGIYQIWTSPIDLSTVGIRDNETESIAKFELKQNYPNPFNPSTKISFQLAEAGFTTLKIYDVLGNDVAVLVNEKKTAGNYEVEFNPESSILYLASGVYLYQLRAGSYVKTKKMILLK